MPTPSAASTTAREASRSMRIPKLLQPRPIAETVRPLSPRRFRRIGADPTRSVPGGEQLLLEGDGRCAFDVERGDRLHAPRLALRALGLRPDDGLVVRGEDQVAARADLDAVPAGLPRVEEEGLLDRVLVRPGLDRDAVLEEDVGGAEHVLALVDEVGDVVQAAAAPRRVERVRNVVGLL